MTTESTFIKKQSYAVWANLLIYCTKRFQYMTEISELIRIFGTYLFP